MKVRPAALIIERNHVLLMQYRYGNTDVFNLPGGNPDKGETLPQALERELREELGIEVEVGELVLAGEVILTQQKNDVLHCVFSTQIIGGIPILNPAETSALAVVWKPISTLSGLAMYPNVGAEIQRLMSIGFRTPYVGRISQVYYE
ncbi:MAG: NUDIX domain-containing protein [Spirosomataceae bacterium]